MNAYTANLQKLRAASGINYSVQVRAGLSQLVTVSYGKRGRSTVSPVTDWISHEAVAAEIAGRIVA